MEEYELAKAKAVKSMGVADHVLNVTYPLVQDPKLLKLVLRNIYQATDSSMLCLMQYEQHNKRLSSFDQSYTAMAFSIRPVLERHRISEGYLSFLNSLHETVQKQKSSDVEFVRKDKFVFASNEYDLSVLTKNELKDYISKAKLFMHEVLGVVK